MAEQNLGLRVALNELIAILGEDVEEREEIVGREWSDVSDDARYLGAVIRLEAARATLTMLRVLDAYARTENHG